MHADMRVTHLKLLELLAGSVGISNLALQHGVLLGLQVHISSLRRFLLHQRRDALALARAAATVHGHMAEAG